MREEISVKSTKKTYSTGFFISCLLFSSNALGSPGKAFKDAAEQVHDFFLESVRHSNGEINKQFNQTLDEILTSFYPQGLSRERIPEDLLKRLRNATMDPVKLIEGGTEKEFRRFTDFDNRGLPSFQSVDRHFELYRAFFQKRLDLDNEEQMNHLAHVVDGYARRYRADRRDILYVLCKHDGFEGEDFELWFEELYATLYRKERFREIAINTLPEPGRGFRDEAFFKAWEDQNFRDFIVQSHFITREHLENNPTLLIHWTDELGKQGALGQLAAFVRKSFNRADRTYDVDEMVNEDKFWKTVLEAIPENTKFEYRIKRILERLSPLTRDQIPPVIGDGGWA